MEGIRDGQATDSCFYCALLYPEIEPCPLCGNKLRYEPAAMQSSAELEEELSEHVERFAAEPDLRVAEALLRLWHRHGEEAGLFLEKSDVSLHRLRTAFDGAGTPRD